MLVKGVETNHGISSVGFSAMAKDSTTQQPGTFWSHPKCFDLSIRFIRVFAEIQAVENLGIGIFFVYRIYRNFLFYLV